MFIIKTFICVFGIYIHIPSLLKLLLAYISTPVDGCRNPQSVSYWFCVILHGTHLLLLHRYNAKLEVLARLENATP